ncbi:hypothetical protein DL768_003476 [Monosporascus sp. mg162]|nr:hypothetical protein DL768_003476 [Monosporascus sp. mg162]
MHANRESQGREIAGTDWATVTDQASADDKRKEPWNKPANGPNSVGDGPTGDGTDGDDDGPTRGGNDGNHGGCTYGGKRGPIYNDAYT